MNKIAPNPRLWNLHQTESIKKSDLIIQSFSVEGKKTYVQIFIGWFNDRANARSVFKLAKQIAELAQEIFESSNLKNFSILFGELQKGFAVGYFFNRCAVILYPAPETSPARKISNGLEFLSASFLNINICQSIFDRTVKVWAGPAVIVCSLGANSVKLCEIIYKISNATSEKEKAKLHFAALSQCTAVAVGSLTLLSLALGTPVLPLAILRTLAVGATSMKIVGSFSEYVYEPVTTLAG